MAISGQTLSIYRGGTLTVSFSLGENITGWPIRFIVCAAEDSATYEVLLTIGAGVTITDGPGGLGTVVLSRVNSLPLGLGPHWFALQYYDGSAAAVPLADGIITVHGPAVLT